jgi:hypothetical protein
MKNTSLGSLLLVLSAGVAAAQTAPDLRRSELTVPSSLGERHANGYWIKEGVFRLIRKRLAAARAADPGQAAGLTALERNLTRLYYTGRFAEYVARVANVPSQ